MDKGIGAVVFDMDGVIFDSERLILVCWEKVGQKHGLVGIKEAALDCIGTNAVKTTEIMKEHYGEEFHYEAYSKEASVMFHEVVNRDGLPVKKGVRELMEYLKAQSIPMALASSTRLQVVTQELQQAGLYEYFRAVVGGDQLKRSKPAPDIYLAACEKLGVEPADAYAIEDSYNGIRASHSAGMRPIMVPDLLPATEEMYEKSIAVLDNLVMVKDFFKEISRRKDTL